jgi:hypothetical protein
MITKLDRAVCKGGWLRIFGLGHTGHYFSQDCGGGDECWRSGCDAQWDWPHDRAVTRPRCGDCGRIVTVGAATSGHWRCEYCLVIDDFRLAQTPYL